MATLKFFPKFYAGWAFEEQSGAALLKALQKEILTIDCTLYIGHSLGCETALKAAQQDTNRKVICIGGFTNFDHWPARVLRRMQQQLSVSPESVLQQFYARCGVPDYTPPEIQKNSLIRGLDKLSNVSIENKSYPFPILSIHGSDDQVTPASDAITPPEIITGAGHCPHLTHANDCVTAIADWLADG